MSTRTISSGLSRMSLAITSPSMEAAMDALSHQAGQVPLGVAWLKKAMSLEMPDVPWAARVQAVLTHEVVACDASGERLASYRLGSRIVAEEDA